MTIVWTDYLKYKANRIKMTYFDKEDVLYLEISDEPEGGSIELGSNITAELNDRGELIGVEILKASDFIRDSILESIQAKMLQLDKAQTA
ncbi:MAG: DUF2283 domain-containing protein [Candidatus Poribacteria bacterium]